MGSGGGFRCMFSALFRILFSPKQNSTYIFLILFGGQMLCRKKSDNRMPLS